MTALNSTLTSQLTAVCDEQDISVVWIKLQVKKTASTEV